MARLVPLSPILGSILALFKVIVPIREFKGSLGPFVDNLAPHDAS